MRDGLAVGTMGEGVEAAFVFECLLTMVVGREVAAMAPGTVGTGWWLGTGELVIPKS